MFILIIKINKFDQQGKKNKKLFWVPAIAPLVSVILSTLFVFITRADKKGVAIVSRLASICRDTHRTST